MCVCKNMCVLRSVDHKVDISDCACFWSRIISQTAGGLELTFFVPLGGQWLFQKGQHAWTGLLFTAESGLMSHRGCYALFELTLLCFRCQMGLRLSQRHRAVAGVAESLGNPWKVF